MQVSFRSVMSISQSGSSRFKRGLWDPEVIEFYEFSLGHLPVEDKYAVKMSITGVFKFDRKRRKRYNGRLWKRQMWPTRHYRLIMLCCNVLLLCKSVFSFLTSSLHPPTHANEALIR